MRRFFYITPFILQTAIWPIVRPMFLFFLRLDIHGIERLKSLPRDRGMIFAVNHGSELDPILLPASLPFLSPLMPMFYTSREEQFYKNSGWRKFFYGGFFFKLWGAHRLGSGQHSYAVSLAPHIQILNDGHSLCMFPDGKRLPESDIGSIAHGGAGYLAWRTGATVVPVRISSAYRTTPADFFLRRRRVRIIFGAPFYFEDVVSVENPTVADFKTAARVIMRKVAALL
ncbi:MAG: 1-acyl-sn-glycerol-3-phosphate acyltransferase [Candidatus Taylorbacteria bacterium]|nr:1-acyl-sn-glycerol-3-phosphate acyltransferase [Candidatus Taylorbacteria bacterium]